MSSAALRVAHSGRLPSRANLPCRRNSISRSSRGRRCPARQTAGAGQAQHLLHRAVQAACGGQVPDVGYPWALGYAVMTLVAGRAHPRRTGRRMPRAPQPSSCFSSSTDAPPDEDHEASREVTEKSQYPDARTDSPIGSLPRSERAHSTSVSHGGSRHLNLLPCSLQPLPERNTSSAHGNTWPDKNNGHGLTSFNPKGATSPEGVIRSSGMRVGPTTKEYRRVGDLSVNHRTS
jgi:hypothetical protein